MRYKNWACEVPDLDPRGFRPVAGKIRLYGGGGGGDAGGEALAASDGFTPSIDLSNISTPSNVVQDASGGGWQTGSGGALASAGLNISLGLDPNTAAFGPLAGTQTAPAGQMSLDAAAQALNMTPEDLQAVQAQSALVGGMPSMLSTSGLDLTTLNQLSDIGLGNVPISGTQTVDQAIASINAHNFLNENIDTMMGMLVPGAGAMMAGTQALGGLMSGVINPQQALGHVVGPVAKLALPELLSAVTNSQALQNATGLTPLNDAQLAAIEASNSSAEGTAGGDAGGATSGTTSGTTDTVAPPVSSASSANPLGLVALLGGVSSDDEEKEQKNMADVRRGIAMTPFGLPYGG